VLHLCYSATMSSKHPRIHTLLEPPLFDMVERLAREHGFSLSEQAAGLIREAVALREDRALDLFATARKKSFDPKKALSLAEVRKRLKA
jgi:hypothetical protein